MDTRSAVSPWVLVRFERSMGGIVELRPPLPIRMQIGTAIRWVYHKLRSMGRRVVYTHSVGVHRLNEHEIGRISMGIGPFQKIDGGICGAGPPLPIQGVSALQSLGCSKSYRLSARCPCIYDSNLLLLVITSVDGAYLHGYWSVKDRWGNCGAGPPLSIRGIGTAIRWV